MRQILADENRQKEFILNGFITTPFLNSDEIKYLLEQLAELNNNNRFFAVGDGKAEYHATHLDSDNEYRKKADNLIREAFSAAVEKLLPDYKILTTNFFIKQAGKGEIHIHHHLQYIENPTDTTVTIWCPLVDVDEENGTIQVVEGSHKIVPYIVGIPYSSYFSTFEDSLYKKYSTPISLKAGEAIIFDDTLIHWSAKNNSKSFRIAAQCLCVPKELTPVIFFSSPTSEEFEIFELDADFFTSTVVADLKTPPEELKKIGSVKNTNQAITEQQFTELLENRSKVRKQNFQMVSENE